MVLSIISLVFAVVALLVNVSALLRRPHIVATWGEVAGAPGGVSLEGLSIIVTARRRSLEVDEVGLVAVAAIPVSLRCPEWLHESEPPRLALPVVDRAGASRLPKRLDDGQSVRAFIDLDSAQEDFPSETTAGRKTVAYVLASGTVYFAREQSALLTWLRSAQAVERA
jgi:hypothetical protein